MNLAIIASADTVTKITTAINPENTEHNTAAVHGVYALTTELLGHLMKTKIEDECLSIIGASSDSIHNWVSIV